MIHTSKVVELDSSLKLSNNITVYYFNSLIITQPGFKAAII